MILKFLAWGTENDQGLSKNFIGPPYIYFLGPILY